MPVGRIDSHPEAPRTDRQAARRLQAQRYVSAHLRDPALSPARIAAALHVSRSTLYAALSEHGEGVAAEIRRQRLERAHAMLTDSAHARPIADIAAAVGLPDPAHFSRIFRAHYGLAPREVRARAAEQADQGDRVGRAVSLS